MYLLQVLSDDKTSEITSLISLTSAYQSLPSTIPTQLTSLLHKTALSHHTRRFSNPTYAGLITSLTAETTSNRPHTREPSGGRPNSRAETYNSPPAFALPPSASGDTLTLRSQLLRFLPPPPDAPPSRHGYLLMIEEVLGKYWNVEKDWGRDDDWRRASSGGLEGSEGDWVYLVTPFVCCLTRSAGVFLAFQKFMERISMIIAFSLI